MIALAVFISLVALALVPGATRVTRMIWRTIARVGARPLVAMLFVFVVAFFLYALPWIFGLARPAHVHDETSYLLAADTFRQGRLTNPSPPFHESFEAVHEIVTPTYASKFPPGQGLILAIGWVIGSPRIGAIVAGAIAATATAWMIRARLSWRLAIIGALTIALLPMVYDWTQTFWGGNFAMAGGALFVGAVMRFRFDAPSRQVSANGAMAGIGLSILANTRPFEGVLLAFIVFIVFLARPMVRGLRTSVQFITGASIVLIPVIAWMGYYNHRVTGSVLQMPYALHARQYMVAPIFWGEGARKPLRTENNYITAFHAQTEFQEYEAQRTPAGFSRLALQRIGLVLKECTYPLVGIVALTGGLAALRYSRTARLALLVPAVFILLHIAMTPWLRAHYLAPVVSCWALFIACAIRDVRRLPLARLRRSSLVQAVSISLILASATYAIQTSISETRARATMPDYRRDAIAAIERMPGRHVVVVAYMPGPQTETQWVQNPADIDAARVIFVHARNPSTNTALVNHFADRSVWMATVSKDGVSLQLAASRNAAVGK